MEVCGNIGIPRLRYAEFILTKIRAQNDKLYGLSQDMRLGIQTHCVFCSILINRDYFYYTICRFGVI